MTRMLVDPVCVTLTCLQGSVRRDRGDVCVALSILGWTVTDVLLGMRVTPPVYLVNVT